MERNPFRFDDERPSSFVAAGRKRRLYSLESIEAKYGDRALKRTKSVHDLSSESDEKESAVDDGSDVGSLATQGTEAQEEEEDAEDEEDGEVSRGASEEPEEVEAPDGKFRFAGRHFGLTYSQVGDADVKVAFEMLKNMDQVEEVICARENHKDGGVHFHVFGSFNKKRNIKNSRHWDLVINGVTLHPNIKKLKGKAGVGIWKRYVCKEGAFLSTMSVDLSTHKNFEQRMKDFKAWKTYCATPLETRFQDSKEQIEGLKLFGTNYPDLSERKRNFWIWGPSEIGKTTAVTQCICRWSVFNRVNEKFPYEGYMGEEFILVDDKPEMKKEEMIHMLNGAFPGRETPVYGETRYQRFFLSSKTKVRYVVLSNDPPSYEHQDWFSSRFTVLNVQSRFGDGDEAQWVVY